MRKFILLALILPFTLLLPGCKSVSKTSGLSILKSQHKIPHLANRICVTKSGTSADKLCDELRSILISGNHKILIFDKENHCIKTDTKDVGDATLQRMTFMIQAKGNDCQVMITTQWKSGAKAVGFAFPVAGYSLEPDWASAQWEKNRCGLAMAESASVANQIENGIVTYSIETDELPWYNRKSSRQGLLAIKSPSNINPNINKDN